MGDSRKYMKLARQIFRWLSIVATVLIVLWCYYVFVYKLCFDFVASPVNKAVYLVIGHMLLVFFVWSCWKAAFAQLDRIPDLFFFLSGVRDELVPELASDALASDELRTGLGAQCLCSTDETKEEALFSCPTEEVVSCSDKEEEEEEVLEEYYNDESKKFVLAAISIRRKKHRQGSAGDTTEDDSAGDSFTAIITEWFYP